MNNYISKEIINNLTSIKSDFWNFFKLYIHVTYSNKKMLCSGIAASYDNSKRMPSNDTKVIFSKL
jgi:hypothetical protein